MEAIQEGVYIHGYQTNYPWNPLEVPPERAAWWAERRAEEPGQLALMAIFLEEARKAEQWVGLTPVALQRKLQERVGLLQRLLRFMGRKPSETTLLYDLGNLQKSGLVCREWHEEDAVFFPTPLLTAILAFEEHMPA